jgi:hypothetical protein
MLWWKFKNQNCTHSNSIQYTHLIAPYLLHSQRKVNGVYKTFNLSMDKDFPILNSSKQNSWKCSSNCTVLYMWWRKLSTFPEYEWRCIFSIKVSQSLKLWFIIRMGHFHLYPHINKEHIAILILTAMQSANYKYAFVYFRVDDGCDVGFI